MDQQKRTLLALGLMMGLTLIYMQLFGPKPSPMLPDGGTPVAAGAPDAGVPAPEIAEAPPPVPGGDAGVAVAPAPPERQVTKAYEKIHYTFNSRGGVLTKAELQGFKMREQPQV